MSIDLLKQQRQFFQSGATRPLAFRLDQLQRLKTAIVAAQDDILAAAKADLGRPAYEAYFEIATIAEINQAIKQLPRWMKPKKVATGIDQFPSQAWIQPDPLGLTLIIGPWNYPFQLIMSPLVGTIAAGNCAVLKPSEHAPHTAAVIEKIIKATFPPNYIAVVQGDASVSQALLAEKWDHIFFTGGTAIGRIVMAAAAKHLTPVTLELGGKSPCIVEPDADLNCAAKRIIWGKFINAGQTCVAPDYLLVHSSIKTELIERLMYWITTFFGEDPAQSPDYARIIHDRHFQRLTHFLDRGTILTGGITNAAEKYIAPTLIDDLTWQDPIMQEEIFGPLLPILTYQDFPEAIDQINQQPKPLALYLFSTDATKQETLLHSTSSGGVCLNDTVMHIAVNDLPFGGVGESGIGAYHGKASFDTFSHFKSVLRKQFWFDLDWRYAPYTADKLKQIRRIVTGA
jgi:aldehyde dehydrogenase (NAD+)